MDAMTRADGDAQGRDPRRLPVRELSSPLDALSVGAVVVDGDDLVVACNDTAQRVLELGGHRPLGRALRTLDVWRAVPHLREEVAAVRRTGVLRRLDEVARGGDRRP